jgi:hypothetical protein
MPENIPEDMYYSLPTKARLRAQQKKQLSCPESSPRSAPGSPKTRKIIASVSGDVSYVRETSSLKSSKSLTNVSSVLTRQSPPKRWSFRRKLHELNIGQEYKQSRNHVASAIANKAHAEPELINLRKLVHDFRMDFIHNSLTARHHPSPPVRGTNHSFNESDSIVVTFDSSDEDDGIKSVPCQLSLSKLSSVDSALEEEGSRISWDSDVFEASTPVPELKRVSGVILPCRKLDYINESDEITKL